jgi:hypothetical protein
LLKGEREGFNGEKGGEVVKMAKEETAGKKPWNYEALLAEYQACQTEAAGAVGWSWQSG